MGTMNLLRASWHGKVGQTVGAKWKGLETIRSYAVPTYTDTPTQHEVRATFSTLTKFLASFSGQLVGLTALDLRKMSIRNALIKLNRKFFSEGTTFDPMQVVISKGSLTTMQGGMARLDDDCIFSSTWSLRPGVSYSPKARCVFVLLDKLSLSSAVISAPFFNFTVSQEVDLIWSTNLICYHYIVDYKGSSRVASKSTVDIVLHG